MKSKTSSSHSICSGKSTAKLYPSLKQLPGSFCRYCSKCRQRKYTDTNLHNNTKNNKHSRKLTATSLNEVENKIEAILEEKHQ